MIINRDKKRKIDRLRIKISNSPTNTLKKNLAICKKMGGLIEDELKKRGVD